VVLTHGMAPFERCGNLPRGQARSKLQGALRAAQCVPDPHESSIVSAYRATNACLEHYPNTSELLRRVIGEERLSGAITETDLENYRQLREAWMGSRVRIVNASWRSELDPGGALACPPGLDAPWLFSMDPMTYRPDGHSDDRNLHSADFERISAAVSSFQASGNPGVAALFVYAVKPDVRPKFWDFVDEISERSGTCVESCWLTHQGGNRNLAGLLLSSFVLPPGWAPDGVNERR